MKYMETMLYTHTHTHTPTKWSKWRENVLKFSHCLGWGNSTNIYWALTSQGHVLSSRLSLKE